LSTTEAASDLGESPRRGAPAVVKPVAVASEVTILGDTRAQAERVGKLLEQSRPALFAEPQVRRNWIAILRATERANDADSILRAAARLSTGEPRYKALADEAWLSSPTNQKMSVDSWPRRAAKVPVVAKRPHLDGKLDESLWGDATGLELRSELKDDEEWPATVKIARDREFLYLAAVCKMTLGRTYEQPSMPRPRDSDLTGFDRVEFLLDTDRDGSTFWKLGCDERGWTFESCGEDATWNPTWYVAAHQDEETWTVEIAIPWDELASHAPANGAVWSVGAQRVIPGKGFQSWSRPAAVSPQSTGFGWLLFD